MTDTEKIREWVSTHDSFAELLAASDTERHAHELLTAVEIVGMDVQEVLEADSTEIGDRDVGWLRVYWEAIQNGDEKAVIPEIR